MTGCSKDAGWEPVPDSSGAAAGNGWNNSISEVGKSVKRLHQSPGARANLNSPIRLEGNVLGTPGALCT